MQVGVATRDKRIQAVDAMDYSQVLQFFKCPVGLRWRAKAFAVQGIEDVIGAGGRSSFSKPVENQLLVVRELGLRHPSPRQ